MTDAVKKVLLSVAAGSSSTSDEGLESDSTNADPQLNAILAKLDPKQIAEALKSAKNDRPSSQKKLFLPAKDAPSYEPTPIEELRKYQQPPTSDPSFSPTYDFCSQPSSSSSQKETPLVKKSYIPGNLDQLSSLKPKALKKKPVQLPKSKVAVFGDIGDLSESDDDAAESNHLIGDILLKGMKSGVFTNVNEVEQQVIRSKVKAKKIKTEPIEAEPNESEEDQPQVEVKTENISCDTVTSSSEDPKEPREPEESEEEKRIRLEREAAKKLVEEKEKELQKIEAKRKVLENYYKNKFMGIESNLPERKEPENASPEVILNKDDEEAIVVISSESESESSLASTISYQTQSESSQEESDEERSTRKRKKSRKLKSKKRKLAKKEKKRKKRMRKEKRRKKRSRSSSSSSESSSSESESESDTDSSEEYRKRHSKKKKKRKEALKEKERKKKIEVKIRKMKQEPLEPNTKPTQLSEQNLGKVKIEKEDPPDKDERSSIPLLAIVKEEKVEENARAPKKPLDPIANVKAKDKPQYLNTVLKSEEKAKRPSAADIILGAPDSSLTKESDIPSESSSNNLDPVTLDEKIEKAVLCDEGERMNPDFLSDAEVDEEELPPNVQSFLDVMNQLDEQNNVKIPRTDMKERRKSSSKDHVKPRSEKSDHKEKRPEKSSSLRHKSSSSSSSSKHKEKSRDERSKKDSDHSKHKSSSRKREEQSSRSKERESRPKEPTKSRSKHLKPIKDKLPRHHQEPSQKKSSRSHSESKSSKSESKDLDPKLSKIRNSKDSDETNSPIPDFSAELDLLPDDLNDYQDDPAEETNVEDDMDDMFEDEDDELRRIFNEYDTTTTVNTDSNAQKKAQRLVKESGSDEKVSSLSRKRIAHLGAAEKSSEQLRPPTKKPRLTPSQMLMNRYKKIQEKQEDESIENQMEQITQGLPSKSSNKRIAHAPNAMEPPKSKLQRQLDARRAATETQPGKQTVAHTLKGMPRMAHNPTTKTMAQLEKPMIGADPSAKVPANVRQRYLNSIVEECLKIYRHDKAKAYERAKSEEKICSDRSKNRNIYLNVVVNCIKRLRSEAAEAAKAVASSSTKPLPDVEKRNMLTTHLQVLAGKPGSIGTWSIEKKAKSDEEIPDDLYYAVMKRYILTREQMEENCYPLADPNEKGKAVVKEDPFRPRKAQPTDPMKRLCDRCNRMYRIDKSGHQLDREDCIYHWGRLIRQRGNRGKFQFVLTLKHLWHSNFTNPFILK